MYHETNAEIKDYFLFTHRRAYCDPHFHSAIEMIFVERGQVTATVGGEEKILREGDACFAPSFCVHSYITDKNDENVSYVLLCPKKYADRIFEKFGQTQPPKFFTFNDFDKLEMLYKTCDLNFSNLSLRNGVFEGAMQILLNLIASKNLFVKRKTDLKGELVCDVLSYASENFSANLTLDELSKKFGYAKESLSRILHKHLNETWNSYLNRLRVNRADEMLKENPNESVYSIAFACGFNSANTFYRAYEKEFGYAPRHNKN